MNFLSKCLTIGLVVFLSQLSTAQPLYLGAKALSEKANAIKKGGDPSANDLKYYKSFDATTKTWTIDFPASDKAGIQEVYARIVGASIGKMLVKRYKE